ncbi:MAG: chemotaxis protein CheB [Planctomycetaceae bacterium]|nr:chemotaxis protein CheB [Planctomycetaceae bacterium]
MANSVEPAAEPPSEILDQRPTHVVGVGASAGGLEALERMFQNMPFDTGMAFVVVQHLSPDFRSLMDELLARWTPMRIHRVVNGMQVEANQIYLIPPKKEMIISDGKLLLADKDPDHGLSLPIDHFFRSLAHDCGKSAIAVILSGTGSDGSRGIEDIKQAGGLVIAQTARTAKFDGMPNAARATELVDLSLDPEEIGIGLERYRTADSIPQLAEELTPIGVNDDGLTQIFRQLRDRYAIDFSCYKLNTIVRRTERRLQLAHLESVQDYAALTATNPEELDALYRDLLVGVTRFFRDSDAFLSLKPQLDELIRQKAVGSEIRAWVAGCATGEEAYSIAMLLEECIRASGKHLTARVFATDVHHRSLEFASEGVYSAEQLGELPESRLKEYFVAGDGKFLVHQTIRQMVVFAPHNIVKDAPFTRMDLITCRNLLIYLQLPAQRKAISLFHFGLRSGAILFLGPSESPGELEEEFEALDPHWKIYRKKRDVRLPIELRIAPLANGRATRASGLPEIATASSRSADAELLGTYDALLAEFMPPALLLNPRHELLQIFGTAGRYLRHKPGRASKDVFDLLDSPLRLAVTGAIQQIHNRRKSEVKLSGVPFKTGVEQELVDVTVRTISNLRTQSNDLLVVLESNGVLLRSAPPSDAQTSEIPEASSSERLESLEVELRYARENLQATIEELETSNEELQATNEELVASNEELQSTNEELQSVNEELYTVNAEHQRKIQELTILTDDMDNLLASTRVHTIFLDRELRIRKFTPQVADTFSFVAADVGRPFESFSHRLRCGNLSDELGKVLKSGELIEEEVQDTAGRWFLMRLLPYWSRGSMDGVLLTLIDISTLKQTQEDLARREFELRMIADHVPSLISYVDRELRYNYVNRRYGELFDRAPAEIVGRTMRELYGDARFEVLRPHVELALAGKTVEFEARIELDHHREFWANISYIPDLNPDQSVRGFFVCKHIITALKESEQRFDRAVRGTTDGIWDWNIRTGKVYYSPRFAELLGCEGQSTELVKSDIDRRIHPDDLPKVQAAEQGLLRNSVPFDVEYRMQCRDGDYHWFRGRAEAVRDAAGRPTHMSGSVQDVEAYRALVDEKDRQVIQRDRFLAVLSHELRNPLGAVVSGCRVLSRDPALPSQLTPVVEVIARQALQMAALLEDLLDVSRITEGKIELQKRVFDLREIVEPAIESVQPLINAREQTVTRLLPPGPLFIEGNPVRMQQVASNLLSNAAKYSPPGTTIDVELKRVDRAALLRVMDQGEGIPPEFLRRVFEPFEQLGRTLDRTDGGMGLGLTLANRLVGLHGGEIEAHSDGPGCGSVFTVRLPIAADDVAVPAEFVDSSLSGSPPRIMLIEDNADARGLLQLLLVQDGFEVASAASGREGIEQIREFAPDVALIDIGLPEMDGYEVARAIRNAPNCGSIVLVALTGYGQPEDRRRAADAGFDAHFTKPLNLQELNTFLRRLPQRPRVTPSPSES